MKYTETRCVSDAKDISINLFFLPGSEAIPDFVNALNINLRIVIKRGRILFISRGLRAFLFIRCITLFELCDFHVYVEMKSKNLKDLSKKTCLTCTLIHLDSEDSEPYF